MDRLNLMHGHLCYCRLVLYNYPLNPITSYAPELLKGRKDGRSSDRGLYKRVRKLFTTMDIILGSRGEAKVLFRYQKSQKQNARVRFEMPLVYYSRRHRN